MRTLGSRNENKWNDMVYLFFHDELGLRWSDDFRGMCFFADEDSISGSVIRRQDVAVAVAFNGFIGQMAQIHVVIKKPEKLTRAMIWETFNYAFNSCGLNVLIGLVEATNTAAIEFDRRLGFTEMATMKDGGLEGDMLIFKMHKADCRWIRRVKNGQEKRTACA